ncbi:large membrane protein [Streptomyces sp. SPB074]|nr:large membrane protein [Streptomyces sp. SPB074]
MVVGVVGAGLFVAGCGGNGDATPAGSVSASGSPAGSAGESPPGIAPGEPDPHGVRYRAAGALPKGPEKAGVYAATGSVSHARAERLARALGVAGDVRAEGGEWRAAGLTIARQAPGSWSYTATDDKCVDRKGCSAPGEAEARRAARPVLAALGLADAPARGDEVQGARRVVQVDPEVAGLPTDGWSTRLRVAAGGTVVGGAGRLELPRSAGAQRYPVRSAAEALAALNEGAGKDGKAVPLTRARFGLAARTREGRPVLVPAWLFSVDARTATLAQTAIDEEHLGSGAPRHPGGAGSAGPGTARGSVPPVSYAVAGRKLSLRFTGGVCARYRAHAEEGGGRVRVHLTEEKEPGKVCVLMAKELTRSVTLDRPLGERTVVTTAGEEVPAA